MSKKISNLNMISNLYKISSKTQSNQAVINTNTLINSFKSLHISNYHTKIFTNKFTNINNQVINVHKQKLLLNNNFQTDDSNRTITTDIKPNPTKLPSKFADLIHREALERTLSNKHATGRKFVDPAKNRPVVPSFQTTPEAWVHNFDNQIIDMTKLNPYFFQCEPRKDILHQVVVWQLAKRRQGTHKTKYRHEVAYTTKKIYRQKGTGRARHGDRGAPIFRGGGHAFAKRPRDYSFDLNKRVRRAGLRMAITTKYLQGNFILLDDFHMDEIKTKIARAKLDNIGINEDTTALFIDGEVLDENFEKSSWNLHYADTLCGDGINVYDILRRDKLVFSKSALEYLENKYERYFEMEKY